MITYSIYNLIYNGVAFFSEDQKEKFLAIERIMRYLIAMSGYYLYLAGIKNKRSKHKKKKNKKIINEEDET